MMQHGTRQTLSLNGEWDFATDPEERGSWFRPDSGRPDGRISVPGSWEEQGWGEPSGHRPIGTWKKEREYEGVAWYAKDVNLPAGFARCQLNLFGVRWHSRVWVDGQYVGEGESLSVPHRFDLTPHIRPGKRQRLVIRVDNRMRFPLGESHIHSYHTSTRWGGITGGASITMIPETRLDRIAVVPNAEDREARFDIVADGPEGISWESCTVEVTVFPKEAGRKAPVAAGKDRLHVSPDASRGSAACASVTLSLGKHARVWSDSDPYLYRAEVVLKQDGETVDRQERVFGIRTFRADGKRLLLNGQPVFLRGYVDCCVFPQTGYPVWDVEHYRRQFRIARQYGFNHVRLHGWTPPEPFWAAADEEGMLVQTELPHWSKFYIDRAKEPPEDVHAFLGRELNAIIHELNAHPSFIMLSMGNELISAEGHPRLNEWVERGQTLDPTRLYTDNTGFGQLPALDRKGDYHIQSLNWHPPHNIDDAAGPDTREDFSAVTRLAEKPLIGHEHAQFTMYVAPDEAKKYQGVLRPHWLETTTATLAKKNVLSRVPEWKRATGIHLIRALKESLEKARRTPGLSGVQLLDIRDFPGQGHATTGVLDVFWDSKGIVDPETFRSFNGERVLLMRAAGRTLYAGETAEVRLELSNFGTAVAGAVLKWEWKSEDRIADKGEISLERVPEGGVFPLHRLQVKAPEGGARPLLLKAELHAGNHIVHNEWRFWSFPRPAPVPDPERIWTCISSLRTALYGARFEPTIGIDNMSYKEENNVDVAIADQLSRDTLQFLLDGGTLWIMAKEGKQQDEVMTRFLPIFWNYLWFPEQVGTTMGMILHDHPLWKHFPHDGVSDWHWYHLVDRAPALAMDGFPHVQPTAEVIDNFNRAKRLAYAFEARVGEGRLFVSTFRLSEVNVLKTPEGRYLLEETLRYLRGPRFRPEATLTVGDVLGMFKVRGQFSM